MFAHGSLLLELREALSCHIVCEDRPTPTAHGRQAGLPLANQLRHCRLPSAGRTDGGSPFEYFLDIAQLAWFHSSTSYSGLPQQGLTCCIAVWTTQLPLCATFARPWGAYRVNAQRLRTLAGAATRLASLLCEVPR